MGNVRKVPYIIDIYTDKAQYIPKDTVKIIIEIENPLDISIELKLLIQVNELSDNLFTKDCLIVIEANSVISTFVIFTAPGLTWKGFGVDALILFKGEICHTRSTAFDVVLSFNNATRYGFLSDFYKQDELDDKDVTQMNKYHINAVQFYDWMYKHDELIPTEDYYIDLLGRELSTKAIKSKINLCHSFGMKAIAYGAIYAASKDYYEMHKDWAFYDNTGKAHNLGNLFYIMNTSPRSPWSEHIVNEFKKAVEVFNFDGIHMDTYGFPKQAFSKLNGVSRLENLGEHFPLLINRTREALEKVKDDINLFFNAVSNWSVETISSAALDAVYIEVWPPCEKYIHLNHLINYAKKLSNKQVILAAYLTPYLKEENINPEQAEKCLLLISAVIFASGGYHLLLGEYNGILAHPYYVRYGTMRKEFIRTVRNYYDFIVRYAKLLYDMGLEDISMTHANGINDEYIFENSDFSSYGEAGKVWTIVKEMAEYKIINLINLSGLENTYWNEVKEIGPIPVKNIIVKALIDEEVKGVYIASPDFENGITRSLDFEFCEHSRGKAILFNVPTLYIWNLIYIKV